MDMTKLMVAFYSFGKAPRNFSLTFISYYNLCIKKIKVLEKTKKTYNKITTEKYLISNENVSKFRYLAMTLKNRNFRREEIEEQC